MEQLVIFLFTNFQKIIIKLLNFGKSIGKDLMKFQPRGLQLNLKRQAFSSTGLFLRIWQNL